MVNDGIADWCVISLAMKEYALGVKACGCHQEQEAALQSVGPICCPTRSSDIEEGRLQGRCRPHILQDVNILLPPLHLRSKFARMSAKKQCSLVPLADI